jgi:hypothetical protein
MRSALYFQTIQSVGHIRGREAHVPRLRLVEGLHGFPLTIEYAGQHILVLALPMIAAILSGIRALVKVLRTPPWPTTTGQQNPMRAATDRAPRSMRLPDS